MTRRKKPAPSANPEAPSEASEASESGETPQRAQPERVDIENLYERALEAEKKDGLLAVSPAEVRHIIEAFLIVTTQKREIGRAIAEAVSEAAQNPLGDSGLEKVRALVLAREGRG